MMSQYNNVHSIVYMVSELMIKRTERGSTPRVMIFQKNNFPLMVMLLYKHILFGHHQYLYQRLSCKL